MRRDYMPKSKRAIYQEKGLFAFSMDSVLLAAFAKAKGRLLDLGCGSGYLAMAASEEATSVTAVDIEPQATRCLARSARENGLDIEVITADIRALNLAPFDTIWTNPPFYRRALKSANGSIARAKHLPEGMRWFQEAARLLKPGGLLYAIVDAPSFNEVARELFEEDLALEHLRPVYWRRGEEARRVLIEARKGGGDFLHLDEALYIYDGEDYTEEVRNYYGR